MSIIAYVGLPGSGKSYDVVANQIMPALAEGRRVVTNIPLNRDSVRDIERGGEIVNLPLDVIAQEPAKIDEYATPGCLLVIDEVWRLWPAGEKANKIPQPYKSLLAEHRHKVDSEGRSMQIVFATQDLAQIAAFARQLVEQTFHHTKLTNVGARGSYRIDVFHGAVTGAVPPVNNRLREIYGKYQPKYFKLYQSHTMSESKRSGANEKAMDKRGNIWRRWQVWAGGAFTLACAIWGTTTLGAIFGGTDSGGMSVANPSAAVPAQSSPASSPGRRYSQPVSKPATISKSASLMERRPSVNYRITGVIRLEGDAPGSIAIMTDGVRSVSVPWERCEDSKDGEVRCEFNGYTVGEFGIVL